MVAELCPTHRALPIFERRVRKKIGRGVQGGRNVPPPAGRDIAWSFDTVAELQVVTQVGYFKTKIGRGVQERSASPRKT